MHADAEIARAVEEGPVPLPGVSPFLSIVDATEERPVVHLPGLAAVQEPLLARVDELDPERERPAAPRQLGQEPGGVALTCLDGVELSQVDDVGARARLGHLAKGDRASGRSDLPG
jgi:hypothetical protein